jgi:hypothetical protein
MVLLYKGAVLMQMQCQSLSQSPFMFCHPRLTNAVLASANHHCWPPCPVQAAVQVCLASLVLHCHIFILQVEQPAEQQPGTGKKGVQQNTTAASANTRMRWLSNAARKQL